MQEQAASAEKRNNTKAIAKYALLPGVLPRLGRLARHVSEFMFIFTQLFGVIGLIDRHHPCLRPENIGVYRFRDVVGLAASNIRWKRENIGQILMFFAIIMSILMLVMLVGTALVGALTMFGTAHAQFFGTPQEYSYSPDKDWALHFLSRITGMDSMFGVAPDGQMLFTTLLSNMLKHYSMAMLVIAAFMVMYLMLMTLTEAARTGKPFGTRFDSIWAPIRMALAIGMLIPISAQGYNGAQMLVMQSAKWGSNLATNVWYSGLNNVGSTKVFSASAEQSGARFIRDIFLVNTCVQIMNSKHARDHFKKIDASPKVYIANVDGFTTYKYGPKFAPDFCGEVKLVNPPTRLSVDEPPSGSSLPVAIANAYKQVAYKYMPNADYANGAEAGLPDDVTMKKMLMAIHSGIEGDNKIKTFPEYIESAAGQSGSGEIYNWVKYYWEVMGREGPDGQFFATGQYPALLTAYDTYYRNTLTKDAQYGWTTAGVFYLRMSSLMANIHHVTSNPPEVTRLPANLMSTYSTPGDMGITGDLVSGMKCAASVLPTAALGAVGLLYSTYKYFFGDSCKSKKEWAELNVLLNEAVEWFRTTVHLPDTDQPSGSYQALGGESYERALDLYEDATPETPSVSGVLRPVFSSMMYLLDQNDWSGYNPLGSVMSLGFKILKIAGVAMLIGLVPVVGMFAWTLAIALLIPGILLAFWLPMLPFLYFTFAVVEWMISVLEAIIGMPLWALSLISLQGEGLGNGTKGVMRVFEIIVRPSIIVMSLIVSVIIFGAGVKFLQQAIDLYSVGYDASIAGGNSLFSNAAVGVGMVFVYMFAIYSLATSCFKLIDSIPDAFGRWGNLPQGFGGSIRVGVQDIYKVLFGAAVLGSLGSKMSGMGKAAGSAAGKVAKFAAGSSK